MKELQKKIEEIEDQYAEETLNMHLDKHAQAKRDKALKLIGAIRSVDQISKSLSTQAIKVTIAFQQEKMHESFGFKRFADFLDESEHSLMTKSEFYQRKTIFENEGETLFDSLSEAGVPLSTRKLLGKGNVQIDGEKVLIVTGAEGEQQTEEIELSDRTRLLQVLSAVADQNATLNAKTNKQKEKIERGEKEIEGLQKKLDAGSFTGKGETTHFEMYMRVITPLIQLRNYIKQLTAIEKAQIKEQGLVYLRSFNGELTGLAQTYGHKNLQLGFDEDAQENAPLKQVKNSSAIAPEENEFASITANLNDEELEELMD